MVVCGGAGGHGCGGGLLSWGCFARGIRGSWGGWVGGGADKTTETEEGEVGALGRGCWSGVGDVTAHWRVSRVSRRIRKDSGGRAFWSRTR